MESDLKAKLASQQRDIERLKKGGGVSVDLALPFFHRRLRETRKRLERARAVRDKALPTGRLTAYRAIGLPWSLTPDAAVAKMVAGYDAAAAEINLKTVAKPLPGVAGQAVYVGHDGGIECHDATDAFVASDPHYRAWATLEEANKTRDLDCVPCHTTGFRQPGGSAFDNIKRFVNVQCEACHGAGSKHVSADGDGDGVLALPSAAICKVCHTHEHSPRFDYDSYRKRLRVPGHGLPAPAVPSPPATQAAPTTPAAKKAPTRKHR